MGFTVKYVALSPLAVIKAQQLEDNYYACVYDVYLGNTDLCMQWIYDQPEYRQYSEFSVAWNYDAQRIYLHQNSDTANLQLNTFSAPFTNQFWLAMLVLFFVFGMSRVLIDSNNPIFTNMNFFQKLLTAIQSAFSGLVFGEIIHGRDLPGKFMDFSMKSLYLVFICIYISNLTVFMTTDTSPNGPDYAIEHDLTTYGYPEVMEIYKKILQFKNPQYTPSEISSLAVGSNDVDFITDQLQQNPISALLLEKSSTFFHEFNAKGMCSNFTQFDEITLNLPSGLPVSSNYLNLFNYYIMQMIQDGTMDLLAKNYIETYIDKNCLGKMSVISETNSKNVNILEVISLFLIQALFLSITVILSMAEKFTKSVIYKDTIADVQSSYDYKTYYKSYKNYPIGDYSYLKDHKESFVKMHSIDCKEIVSEIDLLFRKLKKQGLKINNQDKLLIGRYELLIPKNV